MSSRAIRWDDPAPRLRVSVMVLSCGDSVQPAAEADQRAGGPVDVPDAVQQPAPAAQRPGVGQVGDGLLHQRAQPRLQAVERPLRVAEPVLGAAVPDRGVPVPAVPGQPPSSHSRSPWTVDSARPWAVWAWRLKSYRTFWLAHPRGRCTLVASPSTTTASPDAAISPSQWRRSSRVATKVPSGWQYPRLASGPSSRSRLSPTSVLEIPTARPARR